MPAATKKTHPLPQPIAGSGVTPQQLGAVTEAQRSLADAIQLIGRLDACGAPCAELKARAESLATRIQQFIDQFVAPGS